MPKYGIQLYFSELEEISQFLLDNNKIDIKLIHSCISTFKFPNSFQFCKQWKELV